MINIECQGLTALKMVYHEDFFFDSKPLGSEL